MVNILYLQTDPNVLNSAKTFTNCRYENNLTESDPFTTVNPSKDNDNQRDTKRQVEPETETEGRKQNDLFSSTVYATSEPFDNMSEPKLAEFLENPFIHSPIPSVSKSNNREHNPSYYSDNFNQIQETFGDEYFYDEYDQFPIYSNNKFDRAAHPLAMSMNISKTANQLENPKTEGRKSYHQKHYNSERGFHRLKKIINHYFLVKDTEDETKDQKFTYTLSYMKDIKNWNMAKQSLLLPSNVQEHLTDYVLVEKVYLDKDGNPITNTDAEEKEKEKQIMIEYLTKIAERNKDQIKQNITQSSIKADIRELLNAITIDNYNIIKDDLVLLIKNSPGNQIKFIDVLFYKAVNEKLYSVIYAKLCKDLDRWLTNKKEKTKSPMREHLIDTCKKSFKDKSGGFRSTDDKTVLSQYMIGCVNFISELINVQMISKKVSLQCIKTLLDKFALTNESYLIEASIVLLDKFGSIIYHQSNKIRKEDLDLFNEQIGLRCNELNELAHSKDALPSHIIYKIINLIEKKNNKWTSTLYEQSQILPFCSEDNTISNKSKYNPNANSARVNSRNVNISMDNNSKSNRNSNSNSNSMIINSTQSSIRKSEIIHGPDIEIEEDQNQVVENTKAYNIIFKDIKAWVTFIQNGNNISNYHWKDIDSIYSSKMVYMDQIVSYYIDAALEHFNSLKFRKAKYAVHEYFRVLIEYYYLKLSQKEIEGVIEVVINKLKSYCSMTNSKNYASYVEIMEYLIYYLIKYEIVQMKNFTVFCQEQYSTVEMIIDLLLKVICSVTETRDGMMNSFKETTLYKENIDLVESKLNWE